MMWYDTHGPSCLFPFYSSIDIFVVHLAWLHGNSLGKYLGMVPVCRVCYHKQKKWENAYYGTPPIHCMVLWLAFITVVRGAQPVPVHASDDGEENARMVIFIYSIIEMM